MIHVHTRQVELEKMTAQYEKTDTKLAESAKKATSLEQQLRDAMEALREETQKHQVTAARLRTTEEDVDVVHEQLQEQDDKFRLMEAKVAIQATQVGVRVI